MTVAVIGLNWGDEGKGKIANLLSQNADYVVRYQGGSNAGHTVKIKNKKFVFHHLPSGIIEKRPICILGNGVVIEPPLLLREINELKQMKIKLKDRLYISERAHVILKYHKLIEKYMEEVENIGTTLRGIGPAYGDKYLRTGIRIIDYINDEVFEEFLNKNLVLKKEIIERYTPIDELKQEIKKEREEIKEEIGGYVRNITELLNEEIENGKNIIFEGAQGALLDIDFGTYPYVTSSNTGVGGIAPGTGIAPSRIDKVIGIIKAYTTRVGEGPFPTELNDEIGAKLRESGKEYGATTGRPRRCGWLDLVATKYAVAINGVDYLILTKIDVLSNFSEIKVAVQYKYNGKILETFPADINVLKNVEPVYKSFPGWEKNIGEIKDFRELPLEAQRFIKFIEEYLACPIALISVGDERDANIITLPSILFQ